MTHPLLLIHNALEQNQRICFTLAISRLLIISCLLASFSVKAQSGIDDPEDTRPYNFTFKTKTLLKPCDALGRFQLLPFEESPLQAQFTVSRDSPNPDSLVIYLWNYNTVSSPALATKFNGKYFLISRNDLRTNCIRRYSTKIAFTAGSTIVPVKVRFRPFDFSKDITLGPTIGFRGRMGHYSSNFYNVLLGFGVTSVTLDSATTRGTIKKTTDRPALTPSLGIVAEMGVTQFGFFIGQDYVSKKEVTNWRYHGNIWFSAGLGYTIISRQAKTKPEAQKQ